MKRFIYSLLFVLGAVTIGFSQTAPPKFNYQAVARNADGTFVDTKSIGVRISILEGVNTVYSERQTKITNKYGLFNLEIGGGTVLSGTTISDINWGGTAKEIKIDIDPAGGTSYTSIGQAQLLSVPYALYANTSGNPSTGTTASNKKFIGGKGIQIDSATGTVTITNTAVLDSAKYIKSGNAITAGDLTGTYPSPTIGVGKITTDKLASPTNTAAQNQIILWNGTAWTISTLPTANAPYIGKSGILVNGNAIVANPDGQTIDTTGGKLAVIAIPSDKITTTGATDKQVLTFNITTSKWEAKDLPAGNGTTYKGQSGVVVGLNDIALSPDKITIDTIGGKIKIIAVPGNLIDKITPSQIDVTGATDKQVLTFNQTTGKWEAQNLPVSAGTIIPGRNIEQNGAKLNLKQNLDSVTSINAVKGDDFILSQENLTRLKIGDDKSTELKGDVLKLSNTSDGVKYLVGANGKTTIGNDSASIILNGYNPTTSNKLLYVRPGGQVGDTTFPTGGTGTPIKVASGLALDNANTISLNVGPSLDTTNGILRVRRTRLDSLEKLANKNGYIIKVVQGKFELARDSSGADSIDYSRIQRAGVTNGQVLKLVNGVWTPSTDQTGVAGAGIKSFNLDESSDQTFTIDTTATQIGILDDLAGKHVIGIPLAGNTKRQAGLLSRADYDKFSSGNSNVKAIRSLNGVRDSIQTINLDTNATDFVQSISMTTPGGAVNQHLGLPILGKTSAKAGIISKADYDKFSSITSGSSQWTDIANGINYTKSIGVSTVTIGNGNTSKGLLLSDSANVQKLESNELKSALGTIGGLVTQDIKITTTSGGFFFAKGADEGKVLTSDATGNARWETPTTNTSSYWDTVPSIGIEHKGVVLADSINLLKGVYANNVNTNFVVAGNIVSKNDITGENYTVNKKIVSLDSTNVKFLKIADGTQGSGKVLVSDSRGNASWTTIAGATPYTKGTGVRNLTGNVINVANDSAIWNANKILGRTIDTTKITLTTNANSAFLKYDKTTKQFVLDTVSKASITSNAWNLIGNASTNPATNFIGTTDDQPLVFKTEGKERLKLGGTTNPKYAMEVTSRNEFTDVLIGVTNYGNYEADIALIRRNGTFAAPTAVGLNDKLGVVRFYGETGTGIRQGANITAIAAETWATNKYGTGLQFNVTKKADNLALPAITIDPSGNVGIGSPFSLNAPPREQLDINGGIRLQATATSNTGTIQFDTDNKFKGYDGTSWITFGSGAGTTYFRGTGVRNLTGNFINVANDSAIWNANKIGGIPVSRKPNGGDYLQVNATKDSIAFVPAPSGTSQWTTLSGGIYYNSGKVAIGNASIGKYKLEVTGSTGTDTLYVGDVINTPFVSTDSMMYKKGTGGGKIVKGKVLTANDDNGNVVWADIPGVTPYKKGMGIKSLAGNYIHADSAKAIWDAGFIGNNAVDTTKTLNSTNAGQVLKWNGSTWSAGKDSTGFESLASGSLEIPFYNNFAGNNKIEAVPNKVTNSVMITTGSLPTSPVWAKYGTTFKTTMPTATTYKVDIDSASAKWNANKILGLGITGTPGNGKVLRIQNGQLTFLTDSTSAGTNYLNGTGIKIVGNRMNADSAKAIWDAGFIGNKPVDTVNTNALTNISTDINKVLKWNGTKWVAGKDSAGTGDSYWKKDGVGSTNLYMLAPHDFLGIGTPSPEEKITVENIFGNASLLLNSTGSASSVILKTTATSPSSIDFRVGNTNSWSIGRNVSNNFVLTDIDAPVNPRLFVQKTTGNVGMGVSTPFSKLHIAGGTIRLDSMVGTTDRMVIVRPNGVFDFQTIPTGSGTTYTAGKGVLAIGGGNIINAAKDSAIWNANKIQGLTITGTPTNGKVLRVQNGQLVFLTDSVGNAGAAYTVGNGLKKDGANKITVLSGATLDTTGNILQVKANSLDSTYIADAKIGYSDLTKAGAKNGYALKFENGRWIPAPDSTGTSSGWSLTGNVPTALSSAANYLGTQAGTGATSLRIRTNGTEKVVIDSNGRVGIGVQNVTRAQFEQNGTIGGTAAIFGGNAKGVGLIATSGASGIGFNQYYNAGSKAISSGFSGNISFLTGTGNMTFGISNTANANADSATNGGTKMTLTSAGNLGIRTANPLSKLHVNGFIRSDSVFASSSIAGSRMVTVGANGVLTSAPVPTGSGGISTSSSGLSIIGSNIELKLAATNPGLDTTTKILRVANLDSTHITTNGIGRSDLNANIIDSTKIANGGIGYSDLSKAGAGVNQVLTFVDATTGWKPRPATGASLIQGTDIIVSGGKINLDRKIDSTFTFRDLTGHNITIQPNANKFILLDSVGTNGINVGIGIASPTQKLHISGNSSTNPTVSLVENLNANGAAGYMANAGTLKAAFFVDGSATNSFGGVGTQSNHDFKIQAWNRNAIYINNTSIGGALKIGIGESYAPTNLPTHLLTVGSSGLSDTNNVRFMGYGKNGKQLLYVDATGIVRDTSFSTLSGASNAWNLTGNTVVDSATNYIGTTAVKPLIFKTGGAVQMRISDKGNVFISKDLTVSGFIKSSNITETSDARYKTNVATIDNALATVQQLRGVSYDWKRNEFPEMNFKPSKDLGLIAQEVEKVLPELVNTDDKGFKSVQYSHLVSVLVEAIKEQQKQIETLKAEVLAKDSKVQNSESRIKTLESSVSTLSTQMQLLLELVGKNEGVKASK